MPKNIFHVKKQMSYTLLIFEMRSYPIEIMAMKRIVKHMLKIENVSHISFLELHRKQVKDSKDK